jgi:hypothetical protein
MASPAGNRTPDVQPVDSHFTEPVNNNNNNNNNTRVRQKVKGHLKKHIYCKYTETKLIFPFNVIPLHFNAPVPALHKVFNSVREEKMFTSLTNFTPRQFLDRGLQFHS